MSNKIAETLRRMAEIRIALPDVIQNIYRIPDVIHSEVSYLKEAADLIDAQEQKIERLKRIIVKMGRSVTDGSD